MTVMPDQPKPDEAPEQGDVEEIDERDTAPPIEIDQPDFDDEGDGDEPPKKGRKK